MNGRSNIIIDVLFSTTLQVLHFSRNPAAVAASKRAQGAKDREMEELRRTQENLQEQVRSGPASCVNH